MDTVMKSDGFLKIFGLSLVFSVLLNVCILTYWPGYGLLFLGFCFIGGIGMLPWFRNLRAFGFSSGMCLGIIFSAMFFFRQALFS